MPQVPDHSLGELYVVGTPIGNLEDISFRAIRILKMVDAIASEDTRHTGKLLHHFEIKTPQISYHQHNHKQRAPELLARLQQGQSLALVSDAGLPGISDPGYELVQTCVAANINVVPIPGPSAALTALTASGLPSDRFCFEGFLAAKGAERRDHLAQFEAEPRTIILYESPHRLRQTLQDLCTTLGADRQIVIARELTKLHETFWRGTVEDAISKYETQNPRGEYTLIIAGKPIVETVHTDDELRQKLQTLIDQGISPSQASRQLASILGVSRRYLYRLSLDLVSGSAP
ncbi:Ribosomal RNA small subunit methyltransferase I [Acaryochloris thomasi RCC1774]|uniref:Ribosomal RNA small subunit methyltransferase I n=1 Tax=Acaryochloris thomasi RCC1774 TaxID=1764569 RepID=A0A2W1JFJ5_9CYAN|nr:16S rRNA (cytidine(1402)-2'-O)-methyltransferase [Acaryochloris thomasi]PZD72226.1 Ribosomal RNA small subunit methyltransferase I [Acaryochloris thomasi RCC1774]